jgi:tetratricopeptide (TPR) repeat protein
MPGREVVFKQAMNEGHSAAWDQQWDKAVVAFQKALDEFPDDSKALSSLGLALFQQQKFDEALAAYQHASRVSSTDPVPLEKIAQLSERLGDLPQAIQAALRAADLYIRNQDAGKAVENWLRVTQLDPDHLNAHSYLAMVHERRGQAQQASTEYLALASLLQRSGKADKAAEMVGRALRLFPGNQEARQAQSLLKNGQLLPKPMRPKGGTGPLRMAQVKKMESPGSEENSLDPVGEARQKALTRLAEVLFEYSEASTEPVPTRRGMQAIVKGTGPLSQPDTRTLVLLHLSQAIDAQTRGEQAQAAEELERALEAGFTDPALYFDLGMLRIKGETAENGLRYLQHAVGHNDYALGTRLLMGEALITLNRLPAASIEYMEALKIADAEVVPAEQADGIRQLYEPLIESMSAQTDDSTRKKLCDNIRSLLQHPGWRLRVKQAREQLPKAMDNAPLMPLAEILTEAQSGQVIDAISHIHELARQGKLRSALDEAFYSLRSAPTYLPLHTLIGDLLIQDERIPDAITKFTVVAQAYSVRGEAVQAAALMRRIMQLAPMDLKVRNQLIDLLIARGQTDEALGEYLDLADLYYRLAELDSARRTYAAALHHAQSSRNNREWSIKILQSMADIDMQHLDWKQALRVFEQLRTLRPDDMSVRKNLMVLYIRLNQPAQSAAELENFINYLQTSGHRADAIPFLEDLLKENPTQTVLHRTLAEEYRQAGEREQAISQLDTLGNLLLDTGDKDGAIHVIETILSMDPVNTADYRSVLAKLNSMK